MIIANVYNTKIYETKKHLRDYDTNKANIFQYRMYRMIPV